MNRIDELWANDAAQRAARSVGGFTAGPNSPNSLDGVIPAKGIPANPQPYLDALKPISPTGDHYRKRGPIQPIDLIESQRLPYLEAEIITKVSRHRDKGGLRDLHCALWNLLRLALSESKTQADLDQTTTLIKEMHAAFWQVRYGDWSGGMKNDAK